MKGANFTDAGLFSQINMAGAIYFEVVSDKPLYYGEETVHRFRSRRGRDQQTVQEL
jgi:hypothetical protein